MNNERMKQFGADKWYVLYSDHVTGVVGYTLHFSELVQVCLYCGATGA